MLARTDEAAEIPLGLDHPRGTASRTARRRAAALAVTRSVGTLGRMETAAQHHAAHALSDQLDCRVIGPGDRAYDEARTVFPGGIDRRPAAIARVTNAAEVARVVRFAREAGLELAVRGGGHSTAGHGVSDGGIVVDLRDMRSMGIDLDRRSAWAETGLTTGEYTSAAATCRLATGFGDTGSVGIGGITLGGGIGLLARKHGLTVDSLLAAEVVLADGRTVRADEESHPDLFWAIRGGGGNFGVATKFRFRLHPLDQVVGGMLVLPASAEAIAAFVYEAEAAPDELTTILNVMPAPPLPFLPEEHHGRLVLMATLAYAGPVDAGLRAVAPFRALADPIADMVRPMRYPDLFPPAQEGFHPVAASRAMFVDRVGLPAAEAIMEQLRAATSRMAVAQLRVLGGAVARAPADATAFAHRRRGLLVNLAAFYERLDEAAEQRAWAAGLAAALDDGWPGAYANFLGDEGEARVREAYPGPTWERLAAIKTRYDPTNRFRLNQNIPPEAMAARGQKRSRA
jgi:FAD/FMN-containing dehydrogenase